MTFLYDTILYMNTISISQIKINPSKAIAAAEDFPVAIEKRNEIEGYLLGKDLYEKLMVYIENYVDKVAIEKADFKKGTDFEKVAAELGI